MQERAQKIFEALSVLPLRLTGPVLKQELVLTDRCKLVPVVMRRNHERWTPAYLVERTKCGGYWLVSFDPEKRLHRIKSRAEVVEIEIGLHARLMSRYQQLQRDIQDAIQKRQRAGRAKGAAGRAGKVHHAGRTPDAAQEGG